MIRRIFHLCPLMVAVLLCAAPLHGQQQARQQRKSPHETISRTAANNRITIVYGRPFMNQRKIWGGLVPFGKIWRLGADEATLFITQKALDVGGATIPAGVYTLFMIPEAGGTGQLIFNKEVGQWGIDPYHEENELARVPLGHEALAAPVDQFTISIANGTPDGGVLRIAWDRSQYSVRYSVRK